MSNLPKFSRALLHPRYWLLWLGIGFLWLLVQLPYPVIYRLGTALGRLAMRVMKSRARIARRNLELCFPEMSAADREALLVKNFESLGMGLMETGMAWFWPTHRVARWTETSGVNEVVELLEQKQGILLIGIHFLTLEMGARMYGMFTPGIGVYRPNDNPLIDWLQTWGRLRSNKTMLDRKSERDGQGAERGGDPLVRARSRLRPGQQRFCPAVCRRAGGDHHRHLDAGENVRGDDCAVCSAAQAQRHGV